MKNVALLAMIVGVSAVFGYVSKSPFRINTANAEGIAYSLQGNDALWHLPNFAKSGWFIHASNGRVRACNLDKVSVVGDKSGPRCTNWE
jgi:hypothetical protein